MSSPRPTPALLEAMRILQRAERTESELRASLARKGFPDADIEEAIAHAVAKRWVSDVRVAERVLDRRAQDGVQRVRHELQRRGLEDELIEAAVQAHGPEHDLDRALALIANIDQPAQAARLLARRGFEEDTIREAIERRYDLWS